MTNLSETPAPETSGTYYHAPRDGEDLASSLRQLYLLARRRTRMILLLVAVGTGLAAYFGYSRTPVYTAQSLVMLQPTENRIVDVQAVAAGLGADTTAVETQLRLLSSPVYLARVADRLGLAPAAKDGPLERFASLVPADWLIATGLAQEQVATLDAETAEELRHQNQAERLGRGLKVAQEGRSLVLSISY